MSILPPESPRRVETASIASAVKFYTIPEMASPYADALPDFAGPGRRVLR